MRRKRLEHLLWVDKSSLLLINHAKTAAIAVPTPESNTSSTSESPRAHLLVVGMIRFMSDINQPNLPAPFYSVVVSVSVFMALSTVFLFINSSDNSSLSLFFLSYFYLIGPFNYFFVLSVFFSPDVTLCGWLGLKHQLTLLVSQGSGPVQQAMAWIFDISCQSPCHYCNWPQQLCAEFRGGGGRGWLQLPCSQISSWKKREGEKRKEKAENLLKSARHVFLSSLQERNTSNVIGLKAYSVACVLWGYVSVNA